jgi:hypothetical protein
MNAKIMLPSGRASRALRDRFVTALAEDTMPSGAGRRSRGTDLCRAPPAYRRSSTR